MALSKAKGNAKSVLGRQDRTAVELGGIGEVAVYCPGCAFREFGA